VSTPKPGRLFTLDNLAVRSCEKTQ
jgi:hypothetical protein